MNAKERLRQFVKYKGMGRNRFEELVGISSGYISSGSPSIGSEIIEKIAHVYPDLNIEWLITGGGKMIRDPYGQRSGTARELSYRKFLHVPVVSRYAQAEYLDHQDDKLYINTLPTLPVLAEHEGKGEYMCFEVRGDSMNDGTVNSYKPGDILICREISPRFSQKKLYFNSPRFFLIVHREEGVIVKQIIDCNTEKGEMTVHSLNPLYEDSLIRLDDVKKLFNIIKFQRLL
ncbi:MAG: S24 family peptidase [Prevotellaceae bacterium]|jgi:phage repressor protein C with HTH and peptisase S24 domain|nr:S24 family peptidase [Prevotellaceae bacterium]